MKNRSREQRIVRGLPGLAGYDRVRCHWQSACIAVSYWWSSGGVVKGINGVNLVLALLLSVSVYWVEKTQQRNVLTGKHIDVLLAEQRKVLFADAVAKIHNQQLVSISKAVVSGQRTRLAWSAVFEKLNATPGVESFVTAIFPRKPLGSSSSYLVRTQPSVDPNTASVATFHETEISLDMQLSNEDILLGVLASISRLSGIAVDITHCHVRAFARKESEKQANLTVKCSVKVVEVSV